MGDTVSVVEKITVSPLHPLTLSFFKCSLLTTNFDPPNAFYGLFDAQENILAFCSFGPDGQVPGGDYSLPALDIGLGLRPDLTGQAHGSEYVQAVIDFARRTYAPARLRVTIAEFNAGRKRVFSARKSLMGDGEIQVLLF